MSTQRTGLSITAKTKKKGGKEEPEGIEISSFAHGSGSPSGVVEHMGEKLVRQYIQISILFLHMVFKKKWK